MSKIAFVYDGQGSQIEGMGEDIYHEYPEIRPYFDKMVDDKPISYYCFEGDLDTLSQTQYTQPALLAFDSAISHLLDDRGVKAEATCGLSIGEFASLACSGVITFSQATDISIIRGRAMAHALESCPETEMLAVLGLDEKEILPLLDGIEVYIANLNAPGQVVLSGEKVAMEKLKPRLKEKGARRTIKLKVSGPFHTSLMKEAAPILADYLRDIEFKEPEIPISLNMTGKLYCGEDIKQMMPRQLMNPTRFADDLSSLIDIGVDLFIEIGTKGTIKGFLKRIDKSVKVYQVSDLSSLEDTISKLKGA